MEHAVENVVSGPFLGAVKNAVENLWKIILRISLDLLQICFTVFHTVFHSVFHGASFGSRFIFHDCGKRDRQGQEQPGRTTGPAGLGPSREIQGRLAQPPTASTTIRNKKNTVFFPQLFSGGRAGMTFGSILEFVVSLLTCRATYEDDR